MATQQKFKAIYFPDYKTNNPNAKGLVLAFGERNQDLYKTIAPLSSHEVRELIGTNSFTELEKSATQEGLPINTYCVWRIKKAVEISTNSLFANPILADRTGREIKPIHVTFRGGQKNPLHNWYSFLEGYSPEFVEHILNNFAPQATTIYDPFAGTGVTSIVAAKRGLSALYSEVNPLLQFLVKTKIDASLLPIRQRNKILINLKTLASDLEKLIRDSKPDNELASTYSVSFGKSKFFDDSTFDLVLRVRTLVDEVSYTNQLSADLLQVAVLNALIPSSLLKRAGDVRYRTPKELKQKADFVDTAQRNLLNIINDIEMAEALPARPILLTEDARETENLPQLKIDAVITSPPYLNGTNYFRNTKVELWFLRSLKTPSDLSGFRKSAVTAGINDVSQKSPNKFITHEISQVVKLLSAKSYDKRIPKMVWDYFQDMEEIFNGLKKHLSENAIIAIDIGDSIYGGVKVPTDELLIGVLEKLGYRAKEQVTLRKRMSRSGEVLKQVLLIFESPAKKVDQAESKQKDWWKNDWSSFKKKQPHKELPYSKRNWGHPLHSLCSYQGKLKPSLAYFLVKTFLKPGQRMLDPFAGVGTIPFEGALNGVTSFGFDISPAAVYISKAKLGLTDAHSVDTTIQKLEKFIGSSKLEREQLESIKDFGFNRKLAEYYHPKTFEEILKARQFFKDSPPITPSECLVVASLLHILHGNRPYALSRRSHGITPFAPTGQFEYKALTSKLREKVKRGLNTELPQTFCRGDIRYQDATLWWPRDIDNLDAVITSPPFFDSTRFYLANWIRLWFSGWNQDDFQQKPLGFVDEKQKLGFEIYEPILRQAKERLKPGGVAVFHLGKSNKCNMAEKLLQIAKPWFKTADVFEEGVEDGESHGIRDKGTVVKHQFLILN